MGDGQDEVDDGHWVRLHVTPVNVQLNLRWKSCRETAICPLFVDSGPFAPQPDGFRLDRLFLYLPLHLVHHVNPTKHPESSWFRSLKSGLQADKHVGTGPKQIQVVANL